MVGDRGFEVFACGRGDYGQLGGGNYEHRRAPAKVTGLVGILGKARVVMVAARRNHCAACTSEGELLTWGQGFFGQLGHGNWDHKHTPAKLGRSLFGGAAVVMVSCGGAHTVAVTELGRLFTFGAGDSGQLGHGDKLRRDLPVEIWAGRFASTKIVYTAAGDNHSMVVSSSGRVWTWGWGAHGQLGHDNLEDQLVPKELQGQFGGSKAVMLAAGSRHSMVLCLDGALWGCGSGCYGQLGVGDTVCREAPVRVGAEAFGQAGVLMVACGSFHTMAVSNGGGLWSWGRGEEGRLGHNDKRDRHVPERVPAELFKGANIVTAACGDMHSAAVTEEGALYTWGRAVTYPGSAEPAGLGHEDMENKHLPTLVDPMHLLGARIGRCLPLDPLAALTFAMGTHNRLGAGPSRAGTGGKRLTRRVEAKELTGGGEGAGGCSGQGCLYLRRMPEELVRKVVEACRGWPEGCAGEADGLVRLLGGGSLERIKM